jgi:hypothetical protein
MPLILIVISYLIGLNTHKKVIFDKKTGEKQKIFYKLVIFKKVIPILTVTKD